jgi:hypothetical protein
VAFQTNQSTLRDPFFLFVVLSSYVWQSKLKSRQVVFTVLPNENRIPGVVNDNFSNVKIRPQPIFSSFASLCFLLQLKWTTESESQVIFVSITYFRIGGNEVDRSQPDGDRYDPK